MLKISILLCTFIFFGVFCIFAQHKEIIKVDTYVGTIKWTGITELNKPAYLHLIEYPNKSFKVSFQDAINYGVVIQKKEGSKYHLRGVKGWKIKIKCKKISLNVISIERLD